MWRSKNPVAYHRLRSNDPNRPGRYTRNQLDLAWDLGIPKPCHGRPYEIDFLSILRPLPVMSFHLLVIPCLLRDTVPYMSWSTKVFNKGVSFCLSLHYFPSTHSQGRPLKPKTYPNCPAKQQSIRCNVKCNNLFPRVVKFSLFLFYSIATSWKNCSQERLCCRHKRLSHPCQENKCDRWAASQIVWSDHLLCLYQKQNSCGSSHIKF